MDYKRALILMLSFLAVLAVPIIIYGSSFKAAAFDGEFYNMEFSRYGVYEDLKEYDIEAINKAVLAYLLEEQNNGQNEFIQEDFFNGREKDHLLDVKMLISKVMLAYKLSIFFFLVLLFLLAILLKFNYSRILVLASRIVFFGSLLTLFFAFAILFASFAGFEAFFQRFHGAFFMQGTFTFDPSFEKIVILYPQNIFFDLLARIMLTAIFSSGIAAILFAAFLSRHFFKIFSKNFRRKTL